MPSTPPSAELGAVRVAHPERHDALRWIAILLCLGALVVLVPMWAPLVMAGWFAALGRPLLRRLGTALGGRERAAGVLTVVLLLLMIAPFVIAVVSLYGSAVELAHKVGSSQGGKGVLAALVSGEQGGGGGGGGQPSKGPMQMLQEHGGQALGIVGKVAGATATGLLGIFIFVYGTFVFLVDGPRLATWLEVHAPIAPRSFRRLAAAFHETGRGLIIGNGLTALTQGAVATVTYLVLGVPRAFLLGLLTTVAALIPSIGTGLIWVPVAAGLALTGRTTAAIILAVVGVAVISTVDNLVRPLFSRYAKLEMPAFLILVAVFGGLAVFGTWGLFLGPLLVRLAMEALAIAREKRLTGGVLEPQDVEQREAPDT